ncbi:MAG: aminotransferase class I/II-fold pyridoxal phosphate-dependent enzyme [Candidatus Woesearchaeota archaeon]
MPKQNFINLLQKEVERIDNANVSKRNEKIILDFKGTKAILKVDEKEKEFLIFNSNDYLGLRHNEKLKKAEHLGTEKYGTGPGAVRFISGTLKIHRDLEKELAKFHDREDCIVFSSAFAANMAVIHSLIKGQSKDSLVHDNVLVISDELNHRSIIDGIRIANLPKEQRIVFKHLDLENLKEILEQNKGKYKRVLVISDGIFSMLGEYQDLKKLQDICDSYDNFYEEGIITIIDDSHGVACFGSNGKGCEEFCNAKCDILIGTLGKGFGCDGGYVVSNQDIIDYLRESSATYIYSNSISPGTASAALESVKLVQSYEGKQLLKKLDENINYFKEKIKKTNLVLAADSKHAIQPLLIGDPEKSKKLTEKLFDNGILVTSINYPVVPKGKDEIRIQINASHDKEEIDYLLETLKKNL